MMTLVPNKPLVPTRTGEAPGRGRQVRRVLCSRHSGGVRRYETREELCCSQLRACSGFHRSRLHVALEGRHQAGILPGGNRTLGQCLGSCSHLCAPCSRFYCKNSASKQMRSCGRLLLSVSLWSSWSCIGSRMHARKEWFL
jgi:hypothetical protein